VETATTASVESAATTSTSVATTAAMLGL
jgi:hypothetical protein